jgi:uncharacterized protein DUF3179
MLLMENRKFRGIILGLAVVLSFVAVILPAWLIQPFRLQTPAIIDAAYRVRSAAPLITFTMLVISIAIFFLSWHRLSIWKKLLHILALLLIGVFAWFSLQNHFEWMFNPLPNPSYIRASQNTFLSNQDMVLAVTLNAESVAYPVRLLAYHHLVQDVVGGQPIVSTY